MEETLSSVTQRLETAPIEIAARSVSFITNPVDVLAYLRTNLASYFYNFTRELSSPSLVGVHISDLLPFLGLRRLDNVLVIVDEGDIERMANFPSSYPEGLLPERRRRGKWGDRAAMVGYYSGREFLRNLGELREISFLVAKEVAYFAPMFLMGRLLASDRRQAREGTYRFLSPVRDGPIDIASGMYEEHFFLLWSNEVLLRSYTREGKLETRSASSFDGFPDTEAIGTPVERTFYLVSNYVEFTGSMPRLSSLPLGVQLLGTANPEEYPDRTEDDPLPWPPRGLVNPLTLELLTKARITASKVGIASVGMTMVSTMLGPERLPDLLALVAKDPSNAELVISYLEPIAKAHIGAIDPTRIPTFVAEDKPPVLAFMTEAPSLLEGLGARVPVLGSPPGFPSLGEAIKSDNDIIMDLTQD